MSSNQRMVEVRCVTRALRQLGFEESSHGHKHGKVFKRTEDDLACKPNTLKSEMTYQALYSLGSELEVKQVCRRVEFMHMVKREMNLKTPKVAAPKLAPSTLPGAVVTPLREPQEERTMTTTPPKGNARPVSIGPSAVQEPEMAFEIVRISLFEARVRGTHGDIEVIGQFASKQQAMDALAERLMEQE